MTGRVSLPARGALLWAALAAIAATPLAAGAAWKTGPALQLRLEGRYDSNVIEGGGDGSSLVQPGVGWKFASPTSTVDAIYLFELVSYAHQGPGRGGTNHRLRGDESFRLGRRTTLELQQAFERVYDPTALSRVGVVRTTGTSTFGMASLDLSHRLGRRWSAGIELQEEIARIESPGAVDGAVHAPSIWTRHLWSRRDESRLRWRLQYFQTFGGFDAASNEVTASYRRNLTKTTFVELVAGPALYTQGGATTAEPIGKLEVGRIWPRFTLSAVLERAYFGSTGFEGGLWSEGATGVLAWRISEPLRATLAVGAYRNGVAPAEDAFVEGFGGAAVLEWAIGGDVVAQAAWRRTIQSSLEGGAPLALDISRNVFAIGFAWQLDGGRI
ncbi:MAG TPA: hypothetical protein VN033_13735 [Vulgatibacter sp.]|nr:hypothetical protein [Vulgatibacter sp.]